MTVPSSNGDPILWLALTSNQEDIASTLVKYVAVRLLNAKKSPFLLTFFKGMALTQMLGLKAQRDVCKLSCIEQLMKIKKMLLVFLFEGKTIQIFNSYL